MKKSDKKEEKNGARIYLYALSTCGMCRRVKKLLNDLDVQYDYIDVDLCDSDTRDTIIEEMSKWNSSCPFPMLIINNETCVIGDELDRIRKELGK